MKYNRFVFAVEAWRDGAVRDAMVIVQLTKGSTEALHMVIEDWSPKQDGDLRSIKLAHLTTIERPDDDHAHRDGDQRAD